MSRHVADSQNFARARRRLLRVGSIGIAAASLWTAGCSHHGNASRPQPAATGGATVNAPRPKSPARPATAHTVAPEQAVGQVRVIGARGSFVLIEAPSPAVVAAIAAGSTLHCRPAGISTGASTADLRVSRERRPPFLVADVVSGQPTVGDTAFLAGAKAASAPAHDAPSVPFSSVLTPSAEDLASPHP